MEFKYNKDDQCQSVSQLSKFFTWEKKCHNMTNWLLLSIFIISEPVQTTTKALSAAADCAGPETQKSSSAS